MNRFFQNSLVRFAILIGRVLPRKWGLRLASLFGTLLGSRKSDPMVQAIRANQWVIHEGSITEEELNEKPKTIFRSAAKCMFDYFYFLSRKEKLKDVIEFSPESNAAYDRIRHNQSGIYVCPHTSNFDLMGYALAAQGLEVQVLSYPDPNPSYEVQNKIRSKLGMIVTPMCLSAFRRARTRLREGKSVLTGLDRPLDKQPVKHQPVFFGYKTNLPAAYIRLAIDAGAPVIILAATYQRGGKYRLEGSLPIWMETGDQIEDEITHNANRVLKEAEGLIRQNADQWAMFYPVWPQFLGK